MFKWCIDCIIRIEYICKTRSFCDRLLEYVIEEIISTENPDNGTYITVTTQNAKWKENI